MRSRVGQSRGRPAHEFIDVGWRAQNIDGDVLRARIAFGAAYRRAELAGDVTSMAEAVLGLGGVWVYQHRTTRRALMRARLEHVLPFSIRRRRLALRVRPGWPPRRTTGPGAMTTYSGMLEEAKADPVAYAEALSLAHHCLLGPEHGQRRRELADQLVGEAARAGRRSDLLMGLLWRTVDQFLDGRPARAPRPGRAAGAAGRGGPPRGRVRGPQHRRDAGHPRRSVRRRGDPGQGVCGARGRGRRHRRGGVVRRAAGGHPLVPGPAAGTSADADRASCIRRR